MKSHKHKNMIVAWADGAEIEQYVVKIDASTPGNTKLSQPFWDAFDGKWKESFEYRIKPEPQAKAYPRTKMTVMELGHAYDSAGLERPLIAVANAALRHAIDQDQVVVPSEAVPGIRPFNPYTGRPRLPADVATDPMGILIYHEDEPMRVNRDMEIAKAVRDACLDKFTCFGTASVIDARFAYKLISDVELSAVITTIK